MLQLELIIKSKETESLQKQIEDLKAENEQLRKNVSFLRDSV
jgi:cell division protein FtsB